MFLGSKSVYEGPIVENSRCKHLAESWAQVFGSCALGGRDWGFHGIWDSAVTGIGLMA